MKRASAADEAGRLFCYRLTRLGGEDVPAHANYGTVGMRDLIPAGRVRRAVLTTYEIDVQWLARYLPRERPVLLITHADGGASRQAVRDLGLGNVRVHSPHMQRYGCMHAKLMLLWLARDDRDEDPLACTLRVVVSTANLIAVDYERKCQAVWFQDFGRKSAPQAAGACCDFEWTLTDLLRRMSVGSAKEELDLLAQFDFSGATGVLVTSVPGTHTGQDMRRYGHMKVRSLLAARASAQSGSGAPPKAKRAAADSGPQGRSALQSVWQYSSMGSVSKKWLEEMALSMGRTPLRCVRLVWPTEQFVRDCIDGWSAGGSLCMTAKNLSAVDRGLLYQYKAAEGCGRERVPPHIKTWCGGMDPETKTVEWAVVSSANLSKAAWGALQKNDSQLAILHFEVGILFLPQTPGGVFHVACGPSASQSDEIQCAGHVGDTVTLPYGIPLVPYGPSDSGWVWDEPHAGRDAYGKIWQV